MKREEKSIGEMDHAEFTSYNNRAKGMPLSSFAEFHQGLHGYDVYLNGVIQEKWDIYSKGFTDCEKILKDHTIYTVKRRVGKIILPKKQKA